MKRTANVAFYRMNAIGRSKKTVKDWKRNSAARLGIFQQKWKCV
jgi:hypothetical protein